MKMPNFNSIRFVGLLLIIISLLFNPFLVEQFLTSDKDLQIETVSDIIITEIVIFIIGVILFIFPERMKKHKILLIKLIVLLAIILLFFYIFELVLFLTSTEPVFEINNNRFGFREVEFQIPKPSNTYRIMVLGDSFTWGSGLKEEERYTNKLSQLLNNRSFLNVEVLNFGISGYPTTKERDTLIEYKDRVNPDLIIVGYTINDPQPKGTDYSKEKEKFFYLFRFIDFGKHLGLDRTSNFFRRTLDNIFIKMNFYPDWPEALNRSYDINSSEWKGFERALKDIKNISDELGLHQPVFIILNQGSSTTEPTDYNYPDELLKTILSWYKQAGEYAKNAGFISISIEDMLKNNPLENPMSVSVNNAHPSAEVNDLYATKLSEIIGPIIPS